MIRARWILPLAGPAIENGAVEIDEGRVVDLRSGSGIFGAGTDDLGDVILLPGLINAHCHLDFSGMRGAIAPQKDFSQWIRRINSLKIGTNPVGAIGEGMKELQRWGTTTVVNIESFPEAPGELSPAALRVWWMGELIDIRGPRDVKALAETMRHAQARHANSGGGWGLSPHALFTASEELYRATNRLCRQWAVPWTTHLAETTEEFLMFTEASGPLQEFLAELGRPMDDTGGMTPVERSIQSGGWPPGALLVHMNFLAESDYALLAGRPRGDFSVVHCPKCHAYFSRPKFSLARWQELEIPVCLGTDSLASNDSLNLFEEMRMLRRTHPEISAPALLDMVTRNPARALGVAGRIGEISAGAEADLIAIPYVGGRDGIFDAVVENRSEVKWMMVGGQRRHL